MIRFVRNVTVAVAGAAVLVLGGSAAALASVAPPNGPPPPASTVEQANSVAASTDYVVPAPSDNRSQPSNPSARHATRNTPSTTHSVPAPASVAHANAVNLEFLETCISCTAGEAGATSSRGRATAIRLFGHEVAGGDSRSDASHDGALLALPVNPLLNLAIADWRTTSEADVSKSMSHSHSRAALVDLALLGEKPADSLLTLSVLESASNATYTERLSHGDADANGAVLTVLHGALIIVLLHSETSSDHPGSSYVVSINGSKLVDADEHGDCAGIPIAIPGVLKLTLLRVCADGGSAEIGTVSVPSSSGETAGVVTAQSNGAAVVVPAVTSPSTGVAGVSATPSATAAAGAAGARSVPTTGVSLGLGGLVLVAAGVAVAALALRRRRADAC